MSTAPLARRSLDPSEVIRLYVDRGLTLRQVAGRLDSNHHSVKRVLESNGVTPRRNGPRGPLSAEHRRRLSEACRGRKSWIKGLTMPEDYCRANMRAKLKTGIDLGRFTDFERLKLLTKLLAKRKRHLASDDESRRAFLDRFYFDLGFNAVYDAWLASGKDRWYYPSLDHMTPASRGGPWHLDNLRFVTWFENRAKADMSLSEWESFKARTGLDSDLLIENIVARHRA